MTLVVAVLIPFVATTALTGWYSVSYLEQQTRERMQKDIELVARAIRLPLGHALEQGYERTIQRALESAFAIDQVYGVYVYDREGRPIAATGAREASMGSDRAARIASRGEHREEFAQAGDEEVFSYFVPLLDNGGRISGLLQVTRRGSDFDSYIQSVRTHALSVVTVSGIFLVLIILLGHRWAVGRHLRSVEHGLRQVSRGDLHHRLQPLGPRELQLLAGTVNQMLDAILRSRNALAAQKQRETDLTERLHQSEKMAALGQLAAGVAHELGSPLSTVDGKAQRLLRRADLPEPARQAVQTIRRESERMERIIRQLLDFGRTNPLYRRKVPADRPLRAALKQLGESGREHHITLQVEGAQQSPGIAVDCMRLEQALSNLIRNALQAARQHVRVGWTLDDTSLCYWVDDDGPGIPATAWPHLFEPFFTTKPVGEGTGLGLAVAHAAARDHGGRIEVSDSPLGGARFRLILPLNPESDDAEAE